MKRLLAMMAVAPIALLSVASSALAKDRAVKCNRTYTGITIRDDVVVPRNGTCTLKNSTVKGDVEVRENAYFQATDTSIRKAVEADEAQTVFIDGGSSVGKHVFASKTVQVYLFDSTIGGAVRIYRTTETVNLCGNTVKGGKGIRIVRSGTDILFGDPLTVGCAGNKVTRGDVLIAGNYPDVELVVRGNSIPRGNLFVLDNKGPSDKFVQNNTGGEILRCTGNSAAFVGSPNSGWNQRKGQC
jgi:hypothetical protein